MMTAAQEQWRVRWESLRNEPLFVAAGAQWRRAPWDIAWRDIPALTRQVRLTPDVLQERLKDYLDRPASARPIALYLHIPFCTLQCTYCAFSKQHYQERQVEEYVALLLQEIASIGQTEFARTANVAAIFFGGGTPGVLQPEQIQAIMGALRKAFTIAPTAEITFESSLDDLNMEKYHAAVTSGINRFSFGVQAFTTDVRQRIGRRDTRESAKRRLSEYVAAGRADIVIDLIYGLPGQTVVSIREDVRDAMECGIAGLDLYKLQILPKSILGQQYKRNNWTQDQDKLQELFRAATEELEAVAGPISCSHWRTRESERSLYNTLVFAGHDMVALGMACGGRLGRVRFMKPIAPPMYRAAVAQGYRPMAGSLVGTEDAALRRLTSAADCGVITPQRLDEETDLPMSLFLTPILQSWETHGLVTRRGDAYVYTAAGRYAYKAMSRFLQWAFHYLAYDAAAFASDDKDAKNNLAADNPMSL